MDFCKEVHCKMNLHRKSFPSYHQRSALQNTQITDGPYFQSSSPSNGGHRNKNVLAMEIAFPIAAFLIATFCIIMLLCRRSKAKANQTGEIIITGPKSQREDKVQRTLKDDLMLKSLAPGLPPRFTYSEMEAATNGFEKKLGEGGYGTVYEGVLPSSGTKIAVKVFTDIENASCRKGFCAEVISISEKKHENLVKLCGFCIEDDYRMLVYELMANGSLNKVLFGGKAESQGQTLSWERRKAIAIDTARAVSRLHQDGDHERPVIHCDLKPENILLDENWVAKVSDFGLAKLLWATKRHPPEKGEDDGTLSPSAGARTLEEKQGPSTVDGTLQAKQNASAAQGKHNSSAVEDAGTLIGKQGPADVDGTLKAKQGPSEGHDGSPLVVDGSLKVKHSRLAVNGTLEEKQSPSAAVEGKQTPSDDGTLKAEQDPPAGDGRSFPSTMWDNRKLSSLITSKGVRGTLGYLAPEWTRGDGGGPDTITTASDVYSYGVVLLELIAGRRSMVPGLPFLPGYAFDLLIENQDLAALLDPSLPHQGDIELNEVRMFVSVALWCLQEDVLIRPTMEEVSNMLTYQTHVAPPPVCDYFVGSSHFFDEGDTSMAPKQSRSTCTTTTSRDIGSQSSSTTSYAPNSWQMSILSGR